MPNGQTELIITYMDQRFSAMEKMMDYRFAAMAEGDGRSVCRCRRSVCRYNRGNPPAPDQLTQMAETGLGFPRSNGGRLCGTMRQHGSRCVVGCGPDSLLRCDWFWEGDSSKCSPLIVRGSRGIGLRSPL